MRSADLTPRGQRRPSHRDQDLRVWIEGLEVSSKGPGSLEWWPFHMLICDSTGFWGPLKLQVEDYVRETKLNLNLHLKISARDKRINFS